MRHPTYVADVGCLLWLMPGSVALSDSPTKFAGSDWAML